jgi:signal recognition particle GTPase
MTSKQEFIIIDNFITYFIIPRIESMINQKELVDKTVFDSIIKLLIDNNVEVDIINKLTNYFSEKNNLPQSLAHSSIPQAPEQSSIPQAQSKKHSVTLSSSDQLVGTPPSPDELKKLSDALSSLLHSATN